mmetsp:Transcript_5869/g.16515  ORF Transcript_5869/g.16515 Transcript_5869/m.16515 type:complete len:589 (+) Transcript_5869:195-1961(+)
MSALLGVAIASLVIGILSDKWGRKPCLMLCLYGTVIGCILKFLFRFAFWPYCAFNFLNGLVSASVPVALAYAGDVYETKREKDNEIGILVGVSMLGSSGGGIIAILMETQGLFTPLLVGAAFVAVAAILCTRFIIEPKDIIASRNREKEKELELADGSAADNEDSADGLQPPKTLNKKNFAIIVLGALGDNVGSAGLMPLCLSPLAFNAFYSDFAARGEDPIMSQVAYKWISVLVALMVVPGTIVSPGIYNKLGLAGGCILGNVITGIVTIVLLYLALIRPATNVNFGIFVGLLYLCFPMTVISQLSTGPMLEAITPPHMRGMAQGANITVMNFGAAVSPFILGFISDVAGTPVAIWICIAISFGAGLINVPLMFVKGCCIPPKAKTDDKRPLRGEDKELVERALRGEWVPAKDLEELNEDRFNKGQPYLVIHPRKYQDEKDDLLNLRRRAKDDFLYHRNKTKEYLAKINTTEDLAALCEQANQSMAGANEDEVKDIGRELGEWFAEYIADSGYSPQTDSVLIKQAILSAFPVVNKEKELKPDNVERVLLDTERTYSRLLELEGYDEKGQTIRSILSNAQSAMLQQTL